MSCSESFLRLEDPAAAATARRLGGSLRFGGRAAWICDGEECFASMMADLRAAKRSVRLISPRIRPGVVWDEVFTALRQLAARGADVGLGLPGLETDELSHMHIRPLPPAWRTQLEIDGRIVYAGLPVLCDAFAGLRSKKRAAACLRWEAGPDYGYAMSFDLHRTGAAVRSMAARAEHSVTLLVPRRFPAAALRPVLRPASDAGVQVRVVHGRGHAVACSVDGIQAMTGGFWVYGGDLHGLDSGGAFMTQDGTFADCWSDEPN